MRTVTSRAKFIVQYLLDKNRKPKDLFSNQIYQVRLYGLIGIGLMPSIADSVDTLHEASTKKKAHVVGGKIGGVTMPGGDG